MSANQHHIEKSEALSRQLRELQNNWQGIEIFIDTHTNIYHFHTYLFNNLYSRVSDEDLQKLAIAARLFSDALFVADAIIDHTANNLLMGVEKGTLQLQAMQFESYRILHKLFPPDVLFWERMRTYLQEYAAACLEECQFVSGQKAWQDYTEETAIKIALGKTGMGRTTVAGLVELANDETHFEPLINSMQYFYVARQMWDDLQDWKDDARNSIPSLLLRRLTDRHPSELKRDLGEDWLKKLTQKLYYDGHAEYVLQLALSELDKSEAVIKELPKMMWNDVVAKLRKDCLAMLHDVKKITSENLNRIRQQPKVNLQLPEPKSVGEKIAWNALQTIVEEWQRGFGEARHIMRLSHQEGFSAANEYHYSDVFQRALIADALCDANEILNGTLGTVLNYESQYLLGQAVKTGVGGWRYFPTVPELAPDADDLGQVMQVLLRAGKREQVEAFCEKPLSILLSNQIHEDGGIETWIIPAQNRSPEEEKQVMFNQKWGVGPDTEVMANLLYALTLYDQKRFNRIIEQSAKFLIARQEPNGCWKSRWYYGDYYGTYTCLRFLSATQASSSSKHAIEKATSFLFATQHESDGWGIEKSDQLNTSLALLCLSEILASDSVQKQDAILLRMERGMLFLEKSLNKVQEWQSVDFIRPRMDSPYRSKTITALYALKASLAFLKRTEAVELTERHEK